MNLKHLYYFWKTGKNGGVARAAEVLSLTPQTISGQLRLLEDRLGTALFVREGRSMRLTEAGQLAMDYADEIFALSDELEQAVRHAPQSRPLLFHVGVSDAVPKSLAYRLLQPALDPANPVRMICREWRLDRLLGELATHRLDLVIADSPIPPTLNVRGYNHRLLSSGLSVIAPRALLPQPAMEFPRMLTGLPFLLPGEDSALRRKLEEWIDQTHVQLRIIGEFDDMALLVAFGCAGAGAFVVPTVVEAETLGAGDFGLLGRIHDVQVEYFAVAVERRLTHPCVRAICGEAAIDGALKTRASA